MYPEYPSKLPKRFTPFSSEELSGYYELLKNAGCFVMPRVAGQKLPHPDFWRKGSTAVLEAYDAYGLNGYCVKCGDVYVIDLDPQAIRESGGDPVQVYHQLQNLSPTSFVIVTPTLGVHLYYRIPEGYELLTNAAPPIKGVDARGKGGFVLSLGCVNVYYDEYADKKGVENGYSGAYDLVEGGVYHVIPTMTDALYEFIQQPRRPNRPKENQRIENYGKTKEGNARVKNHMKQSEESRERVVLECLKAILPTWKNKSYESWLQLWMSAHHGANTEKVMRYILEHPSLVWSDGEHGKYLFEKNWYSHKPKEDGYTVASLFYLAKKAGWLTKTGYEIERYQEINVRYVSQWLQDVDVPKRLALLSQTGSGKTQNIVYLWQRLGQPKTVVFVPTIKLAIELSSTLTRAGLPAVCYIDSQTLKRKSLQVMVEAKILVTTLQTFSTKVKPDMRDYGLVYIEESDQIITAFARGGGGMHASQVKEHEAQRGFAVLRDALEHSEYVWAVDATMSQLTVQMMRAMSSELEVIKNTYVAPKPNVVFLEEADDIYGVLGRALRAYPHVVAVCDTAGKCKEIYDTFLLSGLVTEDNAILITRDTERSPRVSAFLDNVDEEAKKYKFVVYNSVMGSGVSINSVTPDVIVQHCSYLTPRNNLQLLNRYRNQKEVYCYYRGGENLYGRDAATIYDAFCARFNQDAQHLNLVPPDRTDNAKLRAYLAAMSIADAELQNRSPKHFYIGLLEEDGRTVSVGAAEALEELIEHSLDEVKELKKAQKKYIRYHWRSVRPIDADNPPDPDMTSLEVACGEVHADLASFFKDKHIPDNLEDFYIYDTVEKYRSSWYLAYTLTHLETALAKTEAFMLDPARAVSTYYNNITKIKLLGFVNLVFESGQLELDKEEFKRRLVLFEKAVLPLLPIYIDEVGGYDAEAVGLSMLRGLLGLLGLKLVEAGGKVRVEDVDHLLELLAWKTGETLKLSFDVSALYETLKTRTVSYKLYSSFDAKQKYAVQDLMLYTEFSRAVKAVEHAESWY